MRYLALFAAACLAAAADTRAELPSATAKALAEATYVYIQSERKSGEWSTPAEIWFYVEDGSVFVGTKPTSWRVRRIGWKRSRARIAVGAPNGPTFDATGTLVHDAALEARLMDAFAKKYPDGWKRYEQAFRDGFKSGERVVVRYTPRDAPK
jgi:hypothetical protein